MLEESVILNSRLAVITPIGCESETLKEFIKKIRENIGTKDIHVLVTDQFTDDNTIAIVREQATISKYIIWHNFHNQYGIAEVYLNGYRKALETDCDYFCEIDAGFSHDPNDISLFVNKLSIHDPNVIFGCRFLYGSKYNTTLKRRILSQGGSKLARLLLKIQLNDLTSGFQLFSRNSLKKILQEPLFSTGPFFQTEMKVRAMRLGFTYLEIPISYSNPSHAVTFIEILDSLRSLWHLKADHVQ